MRIGKGWAERMHGILRREKGLTLIELLIALIISSILVAALYRAFIGQQQSYASQEQVADMQQNVRAAIGRMMREIRMAGFGNAGAVLPVTMAGDTFSHVVNPDLPNKALTIVLGLGEVALTGIVSSKKITVSSLTDAEGNTLFDTTNRKYISIGGLESNVITNINSGTLTLTLQNDLLNNHAVNTPVFAIRAVRYRVANDEYGRPVLRRNEHLGSGDESLADNIESLQLGYLDSDGNDAKATPDLIRMVRVTVAAKTNQSDPSLKGGDGYRRRTITSTIQLRNMGLTP